MMVRKIWTYGVIVAVALICALNYQLLVFPNRFAPAGLNGICTMILWRCWCFGRWAARWHSEACCMWVRSLCF